jgi:hypothetical protein
MSIAVDGSVVGLVSALLMALAGLPTFQSKALALLPSLFFAMTPVVVLAMRAPTPGALVLPFVAAWTGSMTFALHHRRPWPFVLPGLCLGAGLYAHPGAIVTMPLLLLVGVGASISSGVMIRDRRIGMMIAAFVLAALPMVLTLTVTPGEFSRLVATYRLYDSTRFNVLQGLREMFSWVGLVARSEVYYDYFNPSLWFLSGGSIRASLADPRAFLLPFALLVPAGIHALVTAGQGPAAAIAIGGMLVAPIAAALTAAPPIPARLLLAAPFAALLAVHGAIHLASNRRWIVRVAGIAAAASVPVCFGWFQFA